MVDGNIFDIPLSPPRSPHQSMYQDLIESSDSNMALVHSEIPSLSLNTKPMLRSHKSFPYTLRTSGPNHPDTPPLSGAERTPSIANPDDLSSIDDVHSTELPSVTFGGSAPASPLSNLTPTSPKDDDDDDDLDQGQDLNGLNITLDPSEDGEKKPMSAAEIRAQKRKMKRFRLTHNQTRFLMSEFARQAHPDAAHRERLAREIPGLSPRQVQVWFQNRRAKLKRLTSDDRERMMQSRALPDNFDMTQALHSPFGAIHNVGSNMNSPSSYSPSFSDGIRPLNLDSLRRIPDGSHLSPSMNPPFGAFNFTPPQSVTDTLSPVSPAGDSPFNYSPTLDGQRRNNPFAGGVTSPSTFTSHPQIPRLQLHDRVTGTRPESLTSPLRTSMSYPGQGDMNGNDRLTPTINSAPLGSDSNGQNNGMMHYGLGYSYSGSVPGFSATAGSRMRAFNTNVQRIDPSASGPGYSPSRGGAPQSATLPTYTSSPLATPNSFNMMSAPHHITSFPSSYLRPEGSPTEQYPSVGELVGDVDGGDNNENNNGDNMPSF